MVDSRRYSIRRSLQSASNHVLDAAEHIARCRKLFAEFNRENEFPFDSIIESLIALSEIITGIEEKV